jgi:hypothetical protein
MEPSPKLSYFRTQSKYQQIQENQNNPLYHIRSQCNKARFQQHKKTQKTFKHMHIEQQTAEKPMGDRRNKETHQNFPESMKMKIQPTRICGTQQRLW